MPYTCSSNPLVSTDMPRIHKLLLVTVKSIFIQVHRREVNFMGIKLKSTYSICHNLHCKGPLDKEQWDFSIGFRYIAESKICGKHKFIILTGFVQHNLKNIVFFFFQSINPISRSKNLTLDQGWVTLMVVGAT